MTAMRLRRLEIALSGLKGFSHPSARDEQYLTPPDLAARLLYHAYSRGDIGGRRVCDLGSGTGVLAIAASLLGASEVIGVERDPDALATAAGNAAMLGVSPCFIQGDVGDQDIPSRVGPCDTVVMNPPFGAQNTHADRPFIDAALAIAPVVYGVFNAGSSGFVAAYMGDRASIDGIVAGTFSMTRTFRFHTQKTREIPVEIIILRRKGS